MGKAAPWTGDAAGVSSRRGDGGDAPAVVLPRSWAWCRTAAVPVWRYRGGSGAVDVHAGGLHAGGGLHADLQAQLLHRFPGQQGDQTVRTGLDLDLGGDIAEFAGGDD